MRKRGLSRFDHGGANAFAGWLDWMITAGLGLIIAYSIFGLGGYFPQVMRMQGILLGGLLALHGLWLALLPKDERRLSIWGLVFVPFLGYALWSTLAVTPTPWRGKEELLILVQAWIVFWIAIHNARTVMHVRLLLGILITAALVSLAFGVHQNFGNPEWLPLGRVQLEKYFGRASGTFGVPNSFAALMSFCAGFLLYCIFMPRLRTSFRILFGYLALLFLFGLVISVSRGAWIGAAGMLLVFPFFLQGRFLFRLGLSMGVFVLGIAAAWLIYDNVDIVRERLDALVEQRGEVSRKLMWHAGWEIFKEHPWTGSGLASYEVYFDGFRRPEAQINPRYAHNDYLETLSDLGVAGFALFFGPAVLIVARGARAWARLPFLGRPKGRSRRVAPPGKMFLGGILLGLTGFAIHLFVEFHLKIPALLFLVAAALGLVVKFSANRGISVGHGKAGSGLLLGLCLAAGAVTGAYSIQVFTAAAHYRTGNEHLKHFLKYKSHLRDDRDFLARMRRDFEQTVVWEPGHARGWSELSLVMQQFYYLEPERRFEIAAEAEDAALRAVALCEEFWGGHAHLGMARVMGRKPRGETEAHFQAAVRLAALHPTPWLYYAQFLSLDGARDAETLDALDKVLGLDPGNRLALTLRSKIIAR